MIQLVFRQLTFVTDLIFSNKNCNLSLTELLLNSYIFIEKSASAGAIIKK